MAAESVPTVGLWVCGSLPEVIDVPNGHPIMHSVAQGSSAAGSKTTLTLRKWSREDAPTYFEALNASRDFLVKTLPQRAVPATLEEATTKVDTVVRQWDSAESFQYFIWEKSSSARGDNTGEKLIGAISLFNRHGVGSLEVGFWIAEDSVRKGVATRASLALCLAAFEGLSFNASTDSATGDSHLGENRGRASLHSIEVYHDKFAEEKSGGVARKLLFQRREESRYDPGPGPTCSGILVRWVLLVENYEELKAMQQQQL